MVIMTITLDKNNNSNNKKDNNSDETITKQINWTVNKVTKLMNDNNK